jgi:hypothetical protein
MDLKPFVEVASQAAAAGLHSRGAPSFGLARKKLSSG